MTAPQPLLQKWKLEQDASPGGSLQGFYHVGNEVLRGSRNQNVYMVWHHLECFNPKTMLLAQVENQHFKALCNLPLEHIMAVFDAPYDVILESVNIASAALDFHLSSIAYAKAFMLFRKDARATGLPMFENTGLRPSFSQAGRARAGGRRVHG